MTKISRFSSGAPWEQKVGYCRAVKAGPYVEVAGTTAVDEHGNIVGEGDPYEQTRFILQKVAQVLSHFNLGMERVIRTRMYVTDIRQWELVGKAHAEYFADVLPAATMVEVSNLVDSKLLVEIEVTAYAD